METINPTFLSLLPALIAIGLALFGKNVYLALLGGLFSAGFLLDMGILDGLWKVMDGFLVGALADRDHAKIVIFSLLIASMVEVMRRCGAAQDLLDWMSHRIKSRKSAQTMTAASGLVVFFDDYANCLLVGQTMRPLSDKFGISRAKLAFLVDATAAPAATLALVSTWIGFEVGLMAEGLKTIGMTQNAYGFFMEGWAYRFYPIILLFFVFMVASSGRDYGTMRQAELATKPQDLGDDEVERKEPNRKRAVWAAMVPVVFLVVATLVDLYVQGYQAAKNPAETPLFEMIGAADGYNAMMRGGILGWLLAVLGAVIVGKEKVQDVTDYTIDGMKYIMGAMVVLILAWSLGSALGELKAADYLVSILGAGLPGWLCPTAVFVVAAAIAFATGTSFGTMGILMPIVFPLVHGIAPGEAHLLLASAASVLAGACFGDHCSPISDTTVLSSMSSGCDHLEHVRTQLPYALTVGGLSIVLGTLPAGLGVNPWISILLAVGAAYGILRVFGKVKDSQASS
jgi:Na+/H+ antiporter NhaC